MGSADTDRTRSLASRRGTWVLPRWMERQLDPTSPSWVTDDGSGPLRNVAERDVGGIIVTHDRRMTPFADRTIEIVDGVLDADRSGVRVDDPDGPDSSDTTLEGTR